MRPPKVPVTLQAPAKSKQSARGLLKQQARVMELLEMNLAAGVRAASPYMQRGLTASLQSNGTASPSVSFPLWFKAAQATLGS